MKYKRNKTNPESRLNESDMTATMFLNKFIADGSVDQDGDPSINGYDFATEMFDLKSYGFEITVDINSGGGQVIPGLSVFDAVVRTKSNTRVVGLAASMAAAISQAGRRRFMNDIASIMLHGISANGTDDQMMDILNAQLRGVLETRSKLGRERIDQIFESDKDEFFALVGVPDNRHALKMGLVDEIIATGLTMPSERLELAENSNRLVVAYNKILTTESEIEKPKSNKMETNFHQVKAELGLDPEASETAVLKKVQEINRSATENTATKAANVVLKAENKGLKETRVSELVSNAKEVGYPEDQLDGLKIFAESNYDGAQNLVNGLKGAGSLSAGDESGTPASNLSTNVQASAQGKKEEGKKGDLLTYAQYMETPENEKKFFGLSSEDQNKVLDAHASAHKIKTS